MEIQSILKGFLYPSTRVSRCPRFSECTISHKCQNYDQHCLECAICESRVDPPESIGGYIPEGEYLPDMQDAVKKVTEQMLKPFAHPDSDGQRMNGFEITDKYNDFRQATEVLNKFASENKMKLEEKVEEMWVDSDVANLLGRLD